MGLLTGLGRWRWGTELVLSDPPRFLLGAPILL
jgi:hypothetical protein